MEGKYNEVELLFIQEVLDQHGEFLTDLFVDDILAKKLRRSEANTLAERIEYRVSKYGINPVLLFDFPGYGRVIEIRYHQKSINSNLLDASRTNVDIWNIKKQKKRKKDTRWYARNLYGSVNRLLGILGSEYTEYERQRLKNILDKQKIIHQP